MFDLGMEERVLALRVKLLNTLVDAVSELAIRTPNKTALHFIENSKTTNISYAELFQRSLAFASFFKSQNLTSNSVVFIVLKHHRENYETFIGAMMAGLVPSFLPYPTSKQDPERYWQAHEALFKRVNPSCILTYAENVDSIQEALSESSATRVHSIETLGLTICEAGSYSPQLNGDVALLQHSSGTTGLKKGVMLTNAQICDQVESYSTSIDFDATSIVASWLPLYHDMGLFSSFLMPLMTGATIVALDPFDWVAKPTSLFDAIQRYGATHCWMPNFAFSHIRRFIELTNSDVPDLTSVKAIISCSEPVRADTQEQFRAAFARHGLVPEAVQACYAMAETVFAVSQSDLKQQPSVVCVDAEALKEKKQPLKYLGANSGGSVFVSNGAPIAGINVRISSADEVTYVAPSERSNFAGEIEVQGKFVFDGYYLNPQQTEEVMTDDGWYKTGDIGFCFDGELYICGRTKELLIIHGKNYYVGDIEQLVSEVDGVKSGRVVAFEVFDKNTDSDECVVMAETEETDPTRLRVLKREIKAKVLERAMLNVRTVELLAVGTLAKTTSGKMSRSDNKQLYTKGVS